MVRLTLLTHSRTVCVCVCVYLCVCIYVCMCVSMCVKEEEERERGERERDVERQRNNLAQCDTTQPSADSSTDLHLTTTDSTQVLYTK